MKATDLRAGLSRRHPLITGWVVQATRGPIPEALESVSIPAEVPGVVHLDLMRAGLIPDPYVDDHEALLAWIGLVDWTYTTTLEMADDDFGPGIRHELCFDGLDTIATVSLREEVLGEVANQHRRYRFDVTDLLRRGPNELRVAFRSPVRYANERSAAMGARPRPYPFPYEAIRKSACSFGWDWGPATCTSGIWRAAYLESWQSARLSQVLVRAEVEPGGPGGSVEARVRLDRAETQELTLELTLGDASERVAVLPGQSEATVRIHVPEVERWWPAGHGDQPLYDVLVQLRSGEATLDTSTRRVGFRTVRWDTEPDATGTPFQLVVNDRPIFVKGVNWIPDDAFPVRVDRDRYARRLTQAAVANVNLVRVWGGGIYESDDFYDVCDELGLLTWQDFLFACAAYPEDDSIRDEVVAEARDNLTRIGHHASLVMLCGNNESLWGYEDWGWKDLLDGRSWGASYYYDLLPAAVAEVASQVPYTPGSPFSPRGQHPNDPDHGSVHLWEHWNTLDWPAYRSVRPRFAAEFGWQGPPAWSTLVRAVHDEPLTPESPGVIRHQKAIDGHTKLVRGLVAHYRVPDDMPTWHWAMQLNQANAVGCALEWFRSLAPHTSGAMLWQLNDCWPAISWAAIDGDGREKPVYFAIQKAYGPRLVSVQPHGDGLVATLVNDTAEQWRGEAVVSRCRFDGTVAKAVHLPNVVVERRPVTLDIPPGIREFEQPAGEFVTVEALGERGIWFPMEPRDSSLEPPRVTIEVLRSGDVADVTVTAHVLIRDLTLLVDKLDADAVVDRGLVTLLPGESVTFRVRGVPGLDVEAISRPGILRSGNELVVR